MEYKYKGEHRHEGNSQYLVKRQICQIYPSVFILQEGWYFLLKFKCLPDCSSPPATSANFAVTVHIRSFVWNPLHLKLSFKKYCACCVTSEFCFLAGIQYSCRGMYHIANGLARIHYFMAMVQCMYWLVCQIILQVSTTFKKWKHLCWYHKHDTI